MHDNPKRRHHSIVFNLYAIKKLCSLYIEDSHATEEQEAAAKHLFTEVSNRQQMMLQTSMG